MLRSAWAMDRWLHEWEELYYVVHLMNGGTHCIQPFSLYFDCYY